MKVIFLDVDGVLNYSKCYQREENKNTTLVWDKDCVNELNRIIKETGASIVVSSTWRLLDDHYKVLTEEMGIEGEFIGKTKPYPSIIKPGISYTRGDEIQDWITTFCIETNNAPGNIVILDDDSDMDSLLPYLVKTNFNQKGLTKELADEAIVILNKGY